MGASGVRQIEVIKKQFPALNNPKNRKKLYLVVVTLMVVEWSFWGLLACFAFL